ncbi:MAG: hypothetical protein KAJ07_12785, partial [Planctomycetes bacterium]|nr:hypothetical protein [Planctomycetota bacterium]
MTKKRKKTQKNTKTNNYEHEMTQNDTKWATNLLQKCTKQTKESASYLPEGSAKMRIKAHERRPFYKQSKI